MDSKLLFLNEVPPNILVEVRVGIGVLVVHENKILLEKRRDCSLWGCPGGRIEPGENISQTAIRETKEETNVDIKVERVFAIYSDPQYGSIRNFVGDGAPKQIVDIYLLASPLSFEIKKSDESLDVDFFELDKIPSDIVPFIKELIRDYKKDPHNKLAILK